MRRRLDEFSQRDRCRKLPIADIGFIAYSDFISDSRKKTMQEINAQMALKLHQMTGEPVANCSYLLGQTNGDYEMALKILERILQQRQAGKTGSNPAEDEGRSESENGEPGTQTMPDALEQRVYRLETKLAQLADTLDTVNEKLTLLLDKISDPDAP